MKNFYKLSIQIALALYLILLFTGCGQKDNPVPKNQAVPSNQLANAGSKKLYDFKSAIITYETELMGITQHQVFYIDDYGDKEARYITTKMEILGKASENVNVELNCGGYKINYSLSNKKGTKTKSFGSIAGQGSVPNASSLSKKLIDEYKLKDLGEKEIIGKKCKGYSMTMMGMNIESWAWENIPILLMSYGKDGKLMMSMKATNIEGDVSIPADKFTVPSGIELKEN
ncbi:MAG: hypothetical protein ABSG15_05575 [FCB group bacterium]|jgi:hypothetical protein